jgi:hypothetical protein
MIDNEKINDWETRGRKRERDRGKPQIILSVEPVWNRLCTRDLPNTKKRYSQLNHGVRFEIGNRTISPAAVYIYRCAVLWVCYGLAQSPLKF